MSGVLRGIRKTDLMASYAERLGVSVEAIR
jgi:hypothetical protein